MERDQIRGVLKTIFETETGDQILSLKDGVILAQDFELDSVDMVSLIMRVEGHFRVRMTYSELEEVATVGQLIDLVQAKVAEVAIAPPARRAA